MKFFAFMFSALATFFGSVIYYDNHNYIVQKYRFKSDKIKLLDNQKKLRVLVLADLHDQNMGNNNQKLYDKMCSLHPDMIVIPGDLITVRHKLKKSNAFHLIEKIAKKFPVYYGIGNHENRLIEMEKDYGYSFDDLRADMNGVDVKLLHNNTVCFEDYNINLCGFTVPTKYYSKYNKPSMTVSEIEDAIGKVDKSKFTLLMAHNPEDFETYAKWGADLTVSGHIHGGLMVLPYLGGFISPRLRLFPKYDGGVFESNGKRMILSRGLGSHTLPIRIFNPGELTVIDLYAK